MTRRAIALDGKLPAEPERKTKVGKVPRKLPVQRVVPVRPVRPPTRRIVATVQVLDEAGHPLGIGTLEMSGASFAGMAEIQIARDGMVTRVSVVTPGGNRSIVPVAHAWVEAGTQLSVRIKRDDLE